MRQSRDGGFVIRNGNFYLRGIPRQVTPRALRQGLTADLEEAKIWKTPRGARRARREAGMGGDILLVKIEDGRRALFGRLAKE